MNFSAADMTKGKTARVSARYIALFIILISGSPSVFAFQPPLYLRQHSVTSSKYIPADTARKKRFNRAAGQLMLAEVLPWAFDRYIRSRPYARISLQSTAYNLSPAHWAWDGDDFGTNEFAHPYHGSTFFSAFRVNGYNFWQSIPASFAGSYLWETFGENEYPSPNDFINTGFGGVILGEMTFRLSKLIVNNRSSGFKRQAGEVLALLINPMNGYRRILDKKWGKISANSAERDSSRIYTEFDLGLRNYNPNKTRRRFGLYGHLKLLYGNPFANYRKPFSTISINTEFGRDDSSKMNIVNVYGSIAGWELASSDKATHLAILSANYDYIRNEAFYYSAQSIKLNLFSDFMLTPKMNIRTVLGIGPIILAAVPDVYKYRGRNYSYGSGLGVSGSMGVDLVKRFYVSANYRGSLIKTLNGNPSHYFLHTVTGEVRYMLLKNLYLCFEPGYFNLVGHYKYMTDVNETYPYLRFSCRYTIYHP